jgi:hypothetical protein
LACSESPSQKKMLQPHFGSSSTPAREMIARA